MSSFISMKTFFAVLFLLCLVPALQAAPQLSCVRSLRCSIQRYQGCYVVNGMCHCAQAWCCDNPFNFTSLDNCLAVKENTFQLEDPCRSDPCKNNGYCVQLSGLQDPRYRCECHRTGYFGLNCHEKCPKDVKKAIHRLSESKAKFARERIRHLRICGL